MRKYLLLASAALLLGSLFFLIPSCSNKVQKKIKINSEFATYISAYTSGTISNKGTIRVVLATDHEGIIDLNKASDLNVFSFEPSIQGETWWVDQRTIEFRPKEALPNGVDYEAEFDLS